MPIVHIKIYIIPINIQEFLNLYSQRCLKVKFQILVISSQFLYSWMSDNTASILLDCFGDCFVFWGRRFCLEGSSGAYLKSLY